MADLHADLAALVDGPGLADFDFVEVKAIRRLLASHTPSPASDGLREAIEALANGYEEVACEFRAMHDRAPHLHGDRERMEAADHREADAARLRDILAAHTPPSETATETNPLLAEVTWRDRHLEIGRAQLAAANAEIERLHREVGAVAGIVRDDRVRAALQNALGDRSVQQVLRDIRNGATPTSSSDADIAALVERSSLGTEEATALRATVSDERAARIVARSKEIEADADRDAELSEDEVFALATAIYAEGDEVKWLTTVDGSANSASWEYAGRAQAVVGRIVAARLSAIEAVLPTECWVLRSDAGPRCTDMIGGGVPGGAKFTEEMCCIPCRVRLVLSGEPATRNTDGHAPPSEANEVQP